MKSGSCGTESLEIEKKISPTLVSCCSSQLQERSSLYFRRFSYLILGRLRTRGGAARTC